MKFLLLAALALPPLLAAEVSPAPAAPPPAALAALDAALGSDREAFFAGFDSLLRPLAAGFRPEASYLLRELLAAAPEPAGLAGILDQLYDEPGLSGFALHDSRRAVIAGMLRRDYDAPGSRDTLTKLGIERENVLRQCPLLRSVLDGSYAPLPADISDEDLSELMHAAYGSRAQLQQLFSRVDTERRFRSPRLGQARGRTPLLEAARCNNWLMVDTFLLLGADASATDAEGRGLLEQSARPQCRRFMEAALFWTPWRQRLEADLRQADAALQDARLLEEPEEERACRLGQLEHARCCFEQAVAAAIRLRDARLALLAALPGGDDARARVSALMEQDFRSLSQLAGWMMAQADSECLPAPSEAVQHFHRQAQGAYGPASREAAEAAVGRWQQEQARRIRLATAGQPELAALLWREEEAFRRYGEAMENALAPIAPLSGTAVTMQALELACRLCASREAFLALFLPAEPGAPLRCSLPDARGARLLMMREGEPGEPPGYRLGLELASGERLRALPLKYDLGAVSDSLPEGLYRLTEEVALLHFREAEGDRLVVLHLWLEKAGDVADEAVVTTWPSLDVHLPAAARPVPGEGYVEWMDAEGRALLRLYPDAAPDEAAAEALRAQPLLAPDEEGSLFIPLRPDCACEFEPRRRWSRLCLLRLQTPAPEGVITVLDRPLEISYYGEALLERQEAGLLLRAEDGSPLIRLSLPAPTPEP